jgi:electron transport complex protein RnfE
LFILGTIREILGAGTFWGITLFGSGYQPVLLMILPPGAFLALGLLIGGINKFTSYRNKKAALAKKVAEQE